MLGALKDHWSTILRPVFTSLLLLSCIRNVASLNSDGISLLKFKEKVVDPVHYLRDWNETSDTPCEWTGIICSDTGFVISISLSSKNLSGIISESIVDITTLQSIYLDGNFFSSSIPSSIFNLTGLQVLSLGNNLLDGPIPYGFSIPAGLEMLDLSDNWLTGDIPTDIANSSTLQYLNIGNNALEGVIPWGLGTLTNLTDLFLFDNQLTGQIPASLGNLSQLQNLDSHYNHLTGNIPSSFGGLKSLIFLDLSANGLTGMLPPDLTRLQQVQVLRLYTNNFTGPIPSNLMNLSSSLVNLDIATNQFTGPIPEELTKLPRLTLFHAFDNYLTGQIPEGIADLGYLENMFIYNNQLTGSLPAKLGLNQPLKILDAVGNNLSGPIPKHLCAQGQLERLSLFGNQLTGEIPESLGLCPTLWRLRLEYNNLTGQLPSFLALKNLTFLSLNNNGLSGPIPDELANCSSLQALLLSNNQFNGRVPTSLGTLKYLEEFSASGNLLTGSLDSQLCSRLSVLDLSKNYLSGPIPSSISTCNVLQRILLSYNQLSGNIPKTFALMQELNQLDLSHNHLTGPIPVEFTQSTLQTLDVSFNNLSGPVYSSGFFASLNYTDYYGNPYLCAADPVQTQGLTPCVSSTGNPAQRSDRLQGSIKPIFLSWILAGILVPSGVFACLLICCCSKRFRRFFSTDYGFIGRKWTITMFHTIPDLTLEDILLCLDEDNIIGSGGSGTVYKGGIPAGKIFRGKMRIEEHPFVVKRLKGFVNKGGVFDHGFRAEIETLGDIRHNNVVKLLCCCTNNHDTSLLVYEYMPNGNLEDFLHGPKGGTIEWDTRYKIAWGCAQGLSYLHHDCVPPILHRDVKSNNILLDENFEARIADFGLARLLQSIDKMQTMSHCVGSRGYMAPEHAFSLKANEKSDVYSFGVVLLELVTGQHAVLEGKNGEGEDLVMWTRWKIKCEGGLVGSLDPRMKTLSALAEAEMILMLRIALLCTDMSPPRRPCMRDVVKMVEDVKEKSKKMFPGSKIDIRMQVAKIVAP